MAETKDKKTEGKSEHGETQVFKEAEKAVREVKENNAVAVYQDTYMDQVKPDYIVFYDEDKAERFKTLLTEDLPDTGRRAIFAEMDELAGKDVERGSLYWVYRDGEWAIPPEAFIDEAAMAIMQEEDDDWFQMQREHFAGLPEPDPLGDQSRRMREAEESYDEEDDLR